MDNRRSGLSRLEHLSTQPGGHLDLMRHHHTSIDQQGEFVLHRKRYHCELCFVTNSINVINEKEERTAFLLSFVVTCVSPFLEITV